MKQSIESLKRDIAEHTEKLELLNKALALLEPGYPGNGIPAPVNNRQFVGKPASIAVQDFLVSKGGTPATIEELVQVLDSGGCDLHTFPKRTVSTAVGNSDFLERDKRTGMIYLRCVKCKSRIEALPHHCSIGDKAT